VIGLIFGGVCTYFKGVQLIAGVGINLFAAGMVAFWLIHLGVPGHHAVAAGHQLVNIATPYGDFSPMILVAIALPVFIYILLFRTKLGLKIRAVHLLRLLATAAGASLAGLAGAYLSIDWLGSVTKEISAGRGFIALATVVFSGLNPLLWVATMPAVQKVIPWQFIAMAPYAVTLLVVAGVIGRAKFPAAIGTPYQRE
jgi:simple sugar transport system permease protein